MRPMLAETLTNENMGMVRLPVYGSPKFDGFRAFVHHGVLMSRAFKPIPNIALQAKAKHMPHGWDGELIVGNPWDVNGFGKTSSVVTTVHAPVDGVRYFVFDNYAYDARFTDRILSVDEKARVAHMRLDNLEMILNYEARCVMQGYEGIILRNPDSMYKQGRSTMTDQGMMKLKRFSDYEGVLVGMEEMFRNTNEAKIDAQGYIDRGSKKEGMVPANCLGTLLVEFQGQTLRVSQGFTQAMRDEYWRRGNDLHGQLVKFKCPPGGKPVSEGGTGLRPPYVFIGLRSPIDV